MPSPPDYTSVSLQNTVRLRIFLVLLLSLGVRVARTLSSDAVHKATGLLTVNYVLYGGILICSLLPFKSAWVASGFFLLLAVGVGAGSTVLGTVALLRCLTGGQTGCVQTSPADVTALLCAGLIVLIDAFQCWSVYLIVRYPSFIASASQRIRILMAWALPFAWMINIALLWSGDWTFWVTGHLVVDPTLIVLANQGEHWLLGALMAVALAFDVVALMLVSLTLAHAAIWIQIALTGAAASMLCMPTAAPGVDAPGVDAPKEAAAVVAAPRETATLTRRKSATSKIAF